MSQPPPKRGRPPKPQGNTSAPKPQGNASEKKPQGNASTTRPPVVPAPLPKLKFYEMTIEQKLDDINERLQNVESSVDDLKPHPEMWPGTPPPSSPRRDCNCSCRCGVD